MAVFSSASRIASFASLRRSARSLSVWPQRLAKRPLDATNPQVRPPGLARIPATVGGLLLDRTLSRGRQGRDLSDGSCGFRLSDEGSTTRRSSDSSRRMDYEERLPGRGSPVYDTLARDGPGRCRISISIDRLSERRKRDRSSRLHAETRCTPPCRVQTKVGRPASIRPYDMDRSRDGGLLTSAGRPA